ncbi:ATP-binding cassette domain-containing protein [Actinoplanes sp. NPDC000266]
MTSSPLEVAAGEVFGFLGPNGAGKSTTIRLLLGLARPTAGRAWVFGVDAADVARAHRRLAYVPADVALWPQLTGTEIPHLQASTGPGVDTGYQAELVERFAILALPVGGFTAVRMGAFIAAETDRKLALLASRPVTRIRLIGAETGATAVAATVLLTGAGLLTGGGCHRDGRGTGRGRGTARRVERAADLVLLSLGAAVFAVGWTPRWTGLFGCLPGVGGFLLLVIAESVAAPHRIRDISPFAHLAPVPLTGPDTTASAVMIAMAALLIAAATCAHEERRRRRVYSSDIMGRL